MRALDIIGAFEGTRLETPVDNVATAAFLKLLEADTHEARPQDELLGTRSSFGSRPQIR